MSFLAVLLAALAAGNPIPAENAQQGTTEWAGPDVRGTAIQGYSSEVSVAPGGTIHFHISTQPAEAYNIHVFRLGWYGGLGGRLLACIPADCGQVSHGKAYPTPWGGWAGAGWPVSDELTIPVGWPSGYYVAKFELRTGIQEGNAAFQPFVVRPDTERRSSILVQVPVNTWEAYNPWGGKSLYDSNSTGPRATRVSFERPLPRSYQPTWEWEIQLVRFLEREGYDVSCQTDLDTDRDPASLLAHRAVLVDGHDEYWTVAIRDAFDVALARGTNLGFFGANIGYWRIQYEDDHATVHVDKGAGDLFRELTPPRPECDLLGVQFEGGIRSSGDPPRDYTVVAPTDPWLAGTGLTVLPELAGPEWDTLSCGKSGETVLFHWSGAPADADSVRYTAASGARVFSAGSMQFGWGLDTWLPPTRGLLYTAIPGLQQFTRNLLTDFVRPAAPLGLIGAPGGTGVVLHVPPSGDPRVQAVEISRAGRLVCRTAGGLCSDPNLPGHLIYQYDLVAVDEWGRSEPSHLSIAVPNRNPTVRLRRIGRAFVAIAVDRDGDRLSYRWYVDGRRLAATGRRVAPVLSPGRHRVVVRVRDGQGGSAAASRSTRAPRRRGPVTPRSVRCPPASGSPRPRRDPPAWSCLRAADSRRRHATGGA